MTDPTTSSRRARPRRAGLVLGGLAIAGLVLCIVAVGIGSAFIPPTTVAEIMGYRLTGLGDPTQWTLTQDDIVWNLRLPRILLAILVGAALSVVGVVAQAVMRNPLADPFVLGISSGAAFGAVAWLVLGASVFGGVAVGVAAFAGARRQRKQRFLSRKPYHPPCTAAPQVSRQEQSMIHTSSTGIASTLCIGNSSASYVAKFLRSRGIIAAKATNSNESDVGIRPCNVRNPPWAPHPQGPHPSPHLRNLWPDWSSGHLARGSRRGSSHAVVCSAVGALRRAPRQIETILREEFNEVSQTSGQQIHAMALSTVAAHKQRHHK